jgi:hypothetical protein
MLANSQDIDSYAEYLVSFTQELTRQTVPNGTPSTQAQAWWTPEISNAITAERRAHRKWTHTHTDRAWDDYTTTAKVKRRLIASAKQAHWRKSVHEASTSTEGIWKIAKWARTKSHLPPPIPQCPSLATPNGLATTFEEKEQAFRTKFFPPPPDADLDDIEGYTYPQQLPDQGQLTMDETRAAILRPKPLKAPGITGIPHLVIQKSIEVTVQTITNLFQACLALGYHPLEFKKARTIALKKQGKDKDYTKVDSYRPIALLESLGKALERIVASRLSTLAENYSLLPKFQIGARLRRDIITLLDLLIEQIHTI